jgi:signal transduction histidine kinase
LKMEERPNAKSGRRFRSFKTKLMWLVALAVSVPALLTCLILGFQLDRHARALFANGLKANLETFSLVLAGAEQNLFEGVRRAAADNTLQITLDLEIGPQLTKYIEAQREVMGIDTVSIYGTKGNVIAAADGGQTGDARWRLSDDVAGAAPTECVASRQSEKQLVTCNDVAYLVSVAPVFRSHDTNLGDATTPSAQSTLIGYLLGATRIANPSLLASLKDRKITNPIIWLDKAVVYSSIPGIGAWRPEVIDGEARDYAIDGTSYLAAARTETVGAHKLVYAVVSPLAPLQLALRRSLLTVMGLALLLVAATLIVARLIANRLLRPIEQLRVGAARIGKGDLSQRIAINTGDEVEALADQFNDMAGRLQESYSDLENKVEQRTRQLAASLQELRTAQDRLIQTEKLASLGQLTAGIAHEIKNPLNFVNNFSLLSAELIDELEQIMANVEVGDAKRAEVAELAGMLRGNLEKVVWHGKRADSIVKNMLLHSRQGSGERQPADINAIVEESLNLAYHGARAEKHDFNITLERSFDPTAGKVDLFPQEITRVLLNLISNGFYAAAKRKAEMNGGKYEPTLSAATKNLGESVEIRIRDNGTGIPPEVKEKMFNPFFTTKPAGEGTGLGLSLSYDIIVKQHSGSIEVDTAPGEFTEFRIVLPRGDPGIGKAGDR